MSTTANLAALVSISTALAGAGAIACLSAFDLPILLSQPASRSLPSLRWLFSRGSHVFPTVASVAASGFAFLAYVTLLNASPHTVVRMLTEPAYQTARGYILAAALSISIAPFTSLVMVPKVNFALIRLNAAKGGYKSSASATAAVQQGLAENLKKRSAKDSVNGVGELHSSKDLSGPQERTIDDFTPEEERDVRRKLVTFQWLNAVRSFLLGAGGIVGLATAIATR
ncbi:hypothetical protein HKX48_005030 [Thoreauomyces humboldtii]|nr:hypothetical protein HKX48_005030 [Thoreauomyces humboldtii]